jgi:hypothetical protein
LPTSLGTSELARIRTELRERALFSARTTFAEHLQEIRRQVAQTLSGEQDLATAKLRLKESLERLGYRAAEGEAGTLTDLASDRRRDLVIRQNVAMVQGYGQHVQGQTPAFLDAWPAQELVRNLARQEPRDWARRWADAGGRFFAGRMIALKDDPIWERLSRFGTRYPPFDFNSGMGVEDVSRTEAIALGLITRDQVVQPDGGGLNDGLEAAPQLTDADLRDEILQDLGPDYEWAGDTLRRKEAA